MIRIGNIFYILLLTATISILSCSEDKVNTVGKEDNPIIRFDRLLFETDTSALMDKLQDFKRQHQQFFNIYFNNIVPVTGYGQNDKIFEYSLKRLVSDKDLRKIYQLTKVEFGDLKDIKKQFDKAFKRYRKLFGDESTPRLYAYISGFNTQRFIFDENGKDGLAFGLDLFLGDKYPYENLNNSNNTFSSYLVRTYNKDHLVKKVLDMWIEDKLNDIKGQRAIDYMIKNGKKLYILKQLMPEIHDSILLEYTPGQLEWLQNNEKEMWSYYIKKNFFYTTDNYIIKRLVEPTPNSQALGMPRKSPGYTGNYLGYKIVTAYMQRNKEMSLPQLIKEKDAQRILELSKFKPKIK